MSALALPKKSVVRVDQSPMNVLRWCLLLECGHECWVTSKTKPKRKTAPCGECPVKRVKGPYERLVDTVAERVGRKRAREVVEAVFDYIKALTFDDRKRISVPYFGAFFLRTRRPMKTTLPGTGEKCAVPGMEMLGFRPSKYCKRRVTQPTPAP